MFREPINPTEYDKVLAKAKSKYADAIRGYEYQTRLLNNGEYYTQEDFQYLEKRRDSFKSQFTVIEDIFGADKLN